MVKIVIEQVCIHIGAQTVMWVLPQVIGVASPTAFIEIAGLIAVLGTLGFLASTLGLGILTIILASRARAGTVAVFQSSTPD